MKVKISAWRRWCLVAGLGAALLTGVGSGAAATDGGGLPELRIGVTTDIASLDLSKVGACCGIIAQIGDLAYGGLFHYTPGGRIHPELAIRWRYFSTGRGPNKDFEFTLRRNARFSDGSPVTAQAVVAWMEYFAKNGTGYNTFLGPNPRFEAVGRWTVRLHLTVPTPNLPTILSDDGLNVWGLPPSPRALANPSSLATTTHGAGPYRLDASRSVKGDHYTFVPNPYFYNKRAVKFRQIYIKVIANPSSMLQALQAGQLDVAQGDISTAAAAERAGFGVAAALSQGVTLFLNVDAHPALKDVRVRQALNYAIDRRTVVRALLGKYGKVSSQVITTDANPGMENHYGYNPARARQLLREAGYPNGFGFKILSFNFNGVVGDPLVQAYAKYWDAVGIRPEITPVPLTQWLRDYKTAAAFQGAINITPTPTRWGIFLSPNAAYNTWGGDNQIYRLYWAGIRAKDPTTSWKQLWARFTRQAYFVPLAYYSVMYYHAKSITGVTASMTTQRPATPLFTEWGRR
jgi:peptide/nickel transport system substrate-binding protein